MSSRRVAIAGTVVAGLFIAIQFIRPQLPAPPVTGEIIATEPVKQILRTSCYNCHSNETRLPWFDRIVPAYWLAVSDVKRGRKHLNFSELGRVPPAAQKAVLFEVVNQMQLGAMPPKSYEFVHSESRVTPDQLAILKQYLMPPRHSIHPATHLQDYEPPHAPANVRPALNGIEFMPEYKDWKMISSTDRFDNQTLRVVLGNDVAVAAVESNHINPWPDGTKFAKVAWQKSEDGAGEVHAGKFVQVEFMIKDKRKYADTLGWAFARWRGADLQPYGKDANFAEECVGCHTPMRPNDFVFTTPVRSPAGELPADLSKWSVITATMNVQDGTMSTLYGNDLAIQNARRNSSYPPGSVLALVTWIERDDGHWFGARIPGEIKSVEFVEVEPSSHSYHPFSGSPLRPLATVSSSDNQRSDYILSLRASAMP